MKTKDAIARLSFTISKGNKPNDSDKSALNAIIQFINKSDQETVQQHSCFAKLYALILADFTSHYQNINVANDNLNSELKKSLDYHIDILRLKVNSAEINSFFKAKGIKDNFIVGSVDVEHSVSKLKENIELFPTIKIEELKETMETWDTENVTAHLVRNINESLTAYKNV